MDGRAVTSCMVLTMDCDGSSITTIEGLADPETGDLTGLQQAFVDNCGFQCGFCTSGIIMTARALLDEKPCPTEEGGPGCAGRKLLPLRDPLHGSGEHHGLCGEKEE